MGDFFGVPDTALGNGNGLIWQRYLYHFNLLDGSASLPIALPTELRSEQYFNAIWSPDGQTALIFNQEDVGLYFVSAVDEAAVKLSTMFKGKAPPHRFEWLR